LSVNDRIGVIADAASLASSGDSSTSDFLTLLQAYSNETEFIVWQEIALRLDALQSAWTNDSDEIQQKINALSCKLFSPLVKRLGWDAASPSEDSLVSRLRALAIRAAGFAGDEEVISETKRRFAEFFNGDKSVFNADTQGVAFAVAVYKGGRDEYEKVKGYFLDSANPVDQQLSALTSLGYTTDSQLIEEHLEFGLSDKVRSQDFNLIIYPMNTIKYSRERLWKWFQDNYDLLGDRYLASMGYMGVLVRLSTCKFVGDEKAAEIEAFFAEKNTSKFQRVLDQSLEKIRSNGAWFAKDQENVRTWFADSGF
ncbi:Aminopeptidase 2 mitochondrial, partial [Dipsacomyces acuminosporus]